MKSIPLRNFKIEAAARTMGEKSARERKDLGYHLTHLSRTFLPTRKVEGQEWTSDDGRVTLLARKGVLLPYGPYGFAIHRFCTTFLQQNKENPNVTEKRLISLGGSSTEAMRRVVGPDALCTGGERGTLTLLRQAIESFAQLFVSFHTEKDPITLPGGVIVKGKRGKNERFIEDFDLEQKLFPLSAIGEDPRRYYDKLLASHWFAEEATLHSAPSDQVAFRALFPNCLDMNVHEWCSGRAHAMLSAKVPEPFFRTTKTSLRDQFQPGNQSNLRVFWQRFEQSFNRVQGLYPDTKGMLRMAETGEVVRFFPLRSSVMGAVQIERIRAREKSLPASRPQEAPAHTLPLF